MKKVLCFMACLVLGAGLIHAQSVTSGALSGEVVDTNGDAIPGVRVLATDLDTSRTYGTVTDVSGQFRIPNVRPGMYKVDASLAGFKSHTWEGVTVRLGERTNLTVALALAAAEGEIVVVGESSPLISPTKMGVASSVSQGSIEALPSLDRSIFDFARTNPVFSTFSPGVSDGNVLSVSGRNNRYNNIQIDGSVNNDVFGLAATGTPGGQTATQPIQLDAVQELQLVTSSFDVRQGGFTGGAVNVITKSGSNAFSGAVFGYYSDDNMVGNPEEVGEFGTFEDTEYGFSIGGPIMRDKLFFFVNYGHRGYDAPTGFSLDGSSGQAWQGGDYEQEANEFRDFTRSQYGYDPGGLGEVTRERPSDKIFARVDWNINPSNTVYGRWNYVDGSNIIIRPNNFFYNWPGNAYDIQIETNSAVAQWDAIFGDNAFNELRVTYQTIRGPRVGVGDRFPQIRIEDVGGGSGDWQAGTEAFSTFNALDQDIWELTNDFTFFKGNHEIVIGTHNEFYSFDNLFIQNGFGSYRFDSLEDYYAGNAYRFEYTFPNDPNSPSDKMKAYQIGLYAGDTWRAADNVTLVYGLRLDVPFFPDEPGFNQLAFDTYGISTSDVPDGNLLWSPRAGFNWDIRGDAKMQLRGGVGLFTGRVPFVWMSNNYGRTGLTQTSVRVFGDIPFNPDPDNQIPSGSASTQEINAVDPDFNFPQTWRANLAFDYQLPWQNMVFTVEGMWAKSTNEIDFKNLNIQQTGNFVPFDGRPVYEEVSEDFTGAYYLTNTDKGDAVNYIFKLEKPYTADFPLWGSISYAYGDANVVNDGTSSRAVSNWQYTEAADPNNVGLSTSDFSVEHRGVINLNYELNRQTRWSTVFSVFWTHQAGRPWSSIYRGNFPTINGDGYFSNDLIYVPTGPDDVVITNGTWEQLYNYFEQAELTDYAGKIAPRNNTLQPYFTQTDLSIRQNIPVPGRSALQLSFDIFNLMNLFDEEAGWVRYNRFGTVQPVEYEGETDEGLPIYTLRGVITDPDNNPIFQIDTLRSRWRLRLGLRWSF